MARAPSEDSDQPSQGNLWVAKEPVQYVADNKEWSDCADAGWSESSLDALVILQEMLHLSSNIFN